MPSCHFTVQIRLPRGQFALLAMAAFSIAASSPAQAESTATELVIRTTASDQFDPFEERPSAAPVDAAAYLHHRIQERPRQINFQAPPSDEMESEAAEPDIKKDPCAAMADKPLGELGIGIALPAGALPNDFASACWDQLNQAAGPLAAMRAWPESVFHWDATCLCHRPLYFEEVNLERYGYGYGCCLQPFASAAHFFGTIPALPYCMAVECPCECVYTLGHYRPGSCPPWRHNWPPLDPLAAAAEGGVWTGMVFLIP